MMWTVYLDYSRHNGIAIYFISIGAKGQIISKCLFGVLNFSQKMKENTSHTIKINAFVRFLEDFTAWQFAFEINWPLAMYFISIGAWWMICLHSTISHAHKRYHLTIQNWYYSICSIVILDHIFVEFFWLAAAAVICHHWSVEKEQKKRLVDNILKSKISVQILCRMQDA